MELGKLGVWVSMDNMTAAAAAAFAKRVEERGYSALWIPESRGRNALVHSSWLLANTQRLVVATGIANIYARDPMAMANAQRGLNEQSGGRFLLGVGVSHRPMVQGLRGHTYGKPVATMRAYLAAMRDAPYQAPMPREKPLTIVAALGPKMMALSSELADGAHPYKHHAAAHGACPLDPRPRQAVVPGSMGFARDRPGNGAARRAGSTFPLSAARKLRQQLAPRGVWRRRPLWRRLGALHRCHGGVGRRACDPGPDPRTLGRRRRPCLYPTNQRPGRASG
jgi:alkanesulfonate monooxygenase SsuD/methylene tetrahydromethanopterin reductase-like flavin-dependent oxidoreductase (luciferase family)